MAPRYKTLTVHLGGAGEGEQRKAALQRLADQHGYNGISAMLVGMAQQQMENEMAQEPMTVADFVKPNGEALDFQRGYLAYERELARVGRKQARANLIALLAQHVAAMRGGSWRQEDNARQVELAANAFFAHVQDRRSFHIHELPDESAVPL